ncbi:restriction endonuclease subunit S [Oceanimonas sp. AH20CE76]|uniref:restriction endonuclease subunit S n=1 Tax=Oceanimonas sp. AH20CE76 TaxID=2977120 RepID=UPI0031FEAE2F
MNIVELGQISSMKYGKMLSKDLAVDEGFPVYSGYRITGYSKEYLYNDPMLIVVARGVGGTGDVKISPPNAWITNLSIVLELDDSKVDKRYLCYLLNRENLKDKLNSGAAQAQITIDSLAKYRIRLPQIKQQKRTAEFIAKYDDLIENNRRRIQLLDESARLLYQEWFVHLRFPGHEQVKITDGVPEGWEPTLVPDVIDVNPRTPVEKGKEIWYVPMSSLSETSMTANTADFERRTKHTNVKFKKNDVLLARITPCLENGKTGYAYFLAEDEVACGSTEFIVLRGKRVPSEFVYCLARSYPFRENAIKSMTGSSGRQRVQNSCFDKYAVPLPPNSILDEFVQIVQNNFEQIRNLMAQNARLAKARDLLLPKLMSGELTV